jgi:hypothetical protein
MASRRSKHDHGPRGKRPRAAAQRLYWQEAEPADWELTGERDEDKFYLGYTREFWAWGFLEHDLAEEQDGVGRLALIQLLASKKPLAGHIRQALINNLTEAAEFSPRKLIFARRSKASISATKDRAIAHFAQRKAKTKDWKTVITDTAKAFDLSERAVWDALARDKKRHPELHK